MEETRIELIDDTTELGPVKQVLRIGDTVVAATDGITLVKGRSGSGKSHFVLNLIKAILKQEDALGFEVEKGEYNIGYFSTEMSPHQLKRRYGNVVEGDQARRERLKMINLLNVPNEEYLEVVVNAIGLFDFNIVVIDQMADFVVDINSATEAYSFINTLLGVSSVENISIIAIMHQNEESKYHSKARGHLGSTLEQKSISSLAISKGSSGEFTVKSTKIRDGGAFSFRYRMGGDNGMRLVNSASTPEIIKQIDFPITASELVAKIMEVTSKSKTYAHNMRKDLVNKGMLTTEQDGKHVIYRLK